MQNLLKDTIQFMYDVPIQFVDGNVFTVFACKDGE